MSCQQNETFLESRFEALIEVLNSELIELYVCPYCMDDLSIERNACCGEVGHGCTAYTHDSLSYAFLEDERETELRDLAFFKLKVQGEASVHELLHFYTNNVVQLQRKA